MIAFSALIVVVAAVIISAAYPSAYTYRDSDTGFSVSYPVSYNVDLDSKTIHNTAGVRVQIQQRKEQSPSFDLSTALGAARYVDALNLQAAKTGDGKILEETFGPASYRQDLVSGDGERFVAYYVFIGDAHTFYVLLVWGGERDPRAVEEIVSSFKAGN